jgi:hypothetical protein
MRARGDERSRVVPPTKTLVELGAAARGSARSRWSGDIGALSGVRAADRGVRADQRQRQRLARAGVEKGSVVTVTATDARGNATTQRVKVRLR